jgi:hypothetical protein
MQKLLFSLFSGGVGELKQANSEAVMYATVRT